MEAEDELKGIPIMTLEVSDPDIGHKKIVVRSLPLGNLIVVAVMAYMAIFLFKDDPVLQMTYYILIMIITILYSFTFIFFHSHFGVAWQKVVFYDNGIAFPLYLWDKMRGRAGFVPKDQIASVSTMSINRENTFATTTELRFQTKDGKTYTTGLRKKTDIHTVSEWLESSWKLKVTKVDGLGCPIAAPHKVAVFAEAEIRRCEGCGYTFVNDLGFCPSCGRMVLSRKDTINPPKDTAEKPEAPTQAVPTQSYRYEESQRYYAPPYQSPYVEGYTDPQEPNAGYGPDRYQPSRDPYARDPRIAKILAAALGLLGIMGIGHIYMRKVVIGIALMIIGGFLALLSLASIILIFTPDDFPIGVKVVTAIMLSAPFLLLYLWQVFDAPKAIGSKKIQGPNGYNRPPDRP